MSFLHKLLERGRETAALTWLRVRNVISSAAATDVASDTDVSLTTHGDRLRTVHLTIESIAAGSVRPRRLILWLEEGETRPLPRGLRSLEARGLEIRPAPHGLGPHTKYYPYVTTQWDASSNLVTADDDVLYPRRWLEDLTDATHCDDSDVPVVVAYRAHRVRFDDDGRLAPYMSWVGGGTNRPSHLNFGTGVSGVLYPVEAVAALRDAGDGFLALAPRADDIWIHWVLTHAGIPTRQVADHPRLFPLVSSAQETALWRSNVGHNQNDMYLRELYDAPTLHALRHAM